MNWKLLIKLLRYKVAARRAILSHDTVADTLDALADTMEVAIAVTNEQELKELLQEMSR